MVTDLPLPPARSRSDGACTSRRQVRS